MTHVMLGSLSEVRGSFGPWSFDLYRQGEHLGCIGLDVRLSLYIICVPFVYIYNVYIYLYLSRASVHETVTTTSLLEKGRAESIHLGFAGALLPTSMLLVESFKYHLSAHFHGV